MNLPVPLNPAPALAAPDAGAPAAPALSEQTAATIALLRSRAKADSTKVNDASKTRFIMRWAQRNNAQIPFTPEQTMLMLVTMVEAGYSWAYMTSMLSVLRALHADAGGGDPTASPHVRHLIKGIRRTVRTYPLQKKPLLTEDVCKLIAAAQKNKNKVKAARDASLIACTFATAGRGHDVRLMRLEQTQWDPQGRFVIFTLYGSKTDPHNRGQEVTLWATGSKTCPLALLRAWLKVLNRTSGPLFPRVWTGGRLATETITTTNMRKTIRAYLEQIGLDPKDYGVHSLRAGFVTSALLAGASEVDTMRHTRHISIENFRRYHRPEERTNLSKVLGL